MRALTTMAVVLCAGCMQNPDELLPIHGAVIGAEPDQTVRLRRRIEREACEVGERDELLQEAPLDADGGYVFRLFRAEGQALGVPGQFCFRLETSFRSGSRSWSQLNGLLLDNPVAPLRDWNTAVFVDAGLLSFTPVVPLPPDSFTSFAAPAVPASTLDHTLTVTGDAGLIWRATDTTSDLGDGGVFSRREALRLDDAVLEDFSGMAELEAVLADPNEHGHYFTYTTSLAPVHFRPPRDLAVQGAAIPLSRGLACAPMVDPCPFTDGSLEAIDAGLVTHLDLALAQPAVLRALVLRDVTLFGATVAVDIVLEDGGVWTLEDRGRNLTFDGSRESVLMLEDGGFLATSNSYRLLPLDAGSPARAVTVRFPYGLVRLRELSVF